MNEFEILVNGDRRPQRRRVNSNGKATQAVDVTVVM